MTGSRYNSNVYESWTLSKDAGGSDLAGLLLGTGAATNDTNLYRSAIGTLKTDGIFTVGGALNANSTLTVASTLTTTGFTTGSVHFTGAAAALTQDATNFFWDNTDKRLGIGTNAPSAIIHSYTTGAIDQLWVERYGGSAATRGKLRIWHSNIGYSGGTGADTLHTADWGHAFQVNNQSAAAYAMTITNGGLVGIGTTGPSNLLTVQNVLNSASAIAVLQQNQASTSNPLARLDLLGVSGTGSAGGVIYLTEGTYPTYIKGIRDASLTKSKLIFGTNNGGGNTVTDWMTLNSVGELILTSTSVSSSTATGTLILSGGAGIAGAVYIGGALNVTGNITGTLATAAQPNITSVGTLSALTVTATITGSVSGSAATVTGASQTAITTLSNLVSVGVITTGTWRGTVVESVYGGTGVNNGGRTLTIATQSGTLTFTGASLTIGASASVAGSNTGDVTLATNHGLSLTNQVIGMGTPSTVTSATTNSVTTTTHTHALTVTKSDVGLGSVENTALSTWAGTGNITTVGTITSGTWTGGVIGATYGGTGINNGARTLTISTNAGTLSFTNASTTLTIGTAAASVSNANTGDVTLATNHGLSLTNQVIGMGTPSTVTSATTNAVTTTTHSHALTVTKSDVGLSAVENTALSTWAGTGNITTVGTITSGSWTSGVIASNYGGTGVNNAGRTLTLNTNSGTLAYSSASLTLTVAANATVSGSNTGDQTTITGNAGSATYASNTTITDDTTTAATMYPTWVTANTGNIPQKVSSTKLSFVPSTGILSATGFAGPLTGNVTGNVSGSAGSVTWANVSSKPFNYSGQAGQPSWLWGTSDGVAYYVWNPSNFNVNSATTATNATNATYLNVADTRDTALTPNSMIANKVQSAFTNMNGGGWRSFLNIQGWSSGYASWRIIGPANASNDDLWYLQGGVNTTWGTQHTIMHSGNIGSYAPTLTGGGASGNWGINVTGTAASTTRFFSTSHPTSYYLEHTWDGTYWYINGNHPTNPGARVARADTAGSATTAGSVTNSLTAGTGLSGTAFNGSAAQTWNHASGNGYNHIPTGGQSTYVLTWASSGAATWAAPTGGGSSGWTYYRDSSGINATAPVIRTNAQQIDANITMLATENGLSAGPITISSGVTVTIPSGASWSIV